VFSKPNHDFNTFSIEELHKELKNAEKQIEAQKRSMKTGGGRGITSGSMSHNTLAFYQQQKEVIEEAIKNHSQPDSKKTQQFK